MSEIKVNSIKGVGASAAAITVNNTDGTCTANLTNRTNKNLVVNGACLIAQRGTSSTSNGYKTIDRIKTNTDNIGVTSTYSQVDVTSGGAYNAGFRKAWQVTKGAGTANTNSQVNMGYLIEAQDIANSGWKYTDPNSYITISFWLKTSVSNHNPQLLIIDQDSSTSSTKYYFVDIPALTANTWTKITHSIPGHADQVYNNDNGTGLEFQIIPWYGTDFTDAGNTPNAWTSFGTKPVNTTWLTTNNSTFQVTGMQLEVGSVATDFEHRSFAQELTLCQRYFVKYTADASGGGYNAYGTGYQGSATATIHIPYKTDMRAAPTVAISGTNRILPNKSGNPNITSSYMGTSNGYINLGNLSGGTANTTAMLTADGDADAFLSLSAEL